MEGDRAYIFESVPAVKNETIEDVLTILYICAGKEISIYLKMVLVVHIELVNTMWTMLVKNSANL